MALYGHIRLLSVLLGTFLSFCLLLYECKELDGYKFPVYSTELCPRNQTEWNERSSAINCTKDNGYLCFPNEKFTQLLEFCYRTRFIWIQEGYCLYLKKDDSTIYSYSCSSFQFGCHNSSFQSYDLFKHSGCTSIGNGCFIAEPSCKGSDTATSLPETTKPIYVEIVTRNYTTTVSTDEKTNQTLTYNEYVIYDEIFMMPIIAGVLIPIIIFCILCVIYRKGYHIRERKGNIESPEEEECIPLFPATDLNKMETNKEESPLHRFIFEQWQEDNRQFVSTRACKEVEKLIKIQNLVVVTGNSGSGKSAIIQHIALSYRSDDWTVKPVESVNEIIDAFPTPDDLNRGTLLVFNDPIGNESFDEEKNKLWKDHEGKLKCCLRKIKMLVSCRRYILNDARVRGILKDTSCIIDLNDDQHKLNNEEKLNILEKYSNSVLSKEDINKIIKTEEYFPLLCKLYFSDENKRKGVLQFFEEPVKVCMDEINYFRYQCQKNYCALILLVLCNNQLCVEDIKKNDCLKEKFEIALKVCEMKTHTAYHTIGDALKALEGFFVKKIGNTYYFYYNFVMEVTTYVFGTDYPRETIQYADIGFLRRRVNLKSSNDNRTEEVDKFTIYLNDKYVSDLADRLFNDVFGDRLLDVVLNPCMRNEKVATCFIEKLKVCPDKLNELLAKKQLHEKFRKQEDNQALTSSFGSKVEFLYYEDKVPILSAIIVFCHTNLSKYCLEALQTLSSIKSKYFFCAVCCNGSMDLFNVLKKTNRIKEFLMETWGEYSPIHIVSLFHNHEILKELIGVGNDVEMQAKFEGEKHGRTPLMLAAVNAEDNKDKIDKTVKLLLTNGADVNSCHPIFGSSLHIAAADGNQYTVELLLGADAKINIRNENGDTPLHKASENGHEKVVKLLLSKKAKTNSCNKFIETPLHKASENGHEKVVQLLLSKKAKINACNKLKETPLHKASENGHERVVQLLLSERANINSCRVVQLLLNKKANTNSCDKFKETPLYKASANGHERVVQLLLSKANTNLCNNFKQTPLHKASENGHEIVVQLLLSKDADINACDKDGETPLLKAQRKRHERIVQLLSSKAAKVKSCNNEGETLFHQASK